MKGFFCLVLFGCFFCLGCSDDDVKTPATVPAGLAATGSLGEIHLSWTPSSGDGLSGYNVYRSSDGTTYSLLGESTVTSYTDTIASPAGDGVLYAYRVSAVGSQGESGYSSSVHSMHGTRISGTHPGSDLTLSNSSPFVIEGTFHCQGDLNIESGIKLYLLAGSTLMMSNDNRISVHGTLQMRGVPGSPVTVSATKTGGLNDGEGFEMSIRTEATNVRMEHALLTNIAAANSINIFTGAIVSNCKFYSTSTTGGSYVTLRKTPGKAPVIIQSSFSRMVLSINSDFRGTPFSLQRNRCHGGYYALSFMSMSSLPLDADMVKDNVFDASSPRTLYIYNITATGTIPLTNNYWSGGTNDPPIPGLKITGSPDITLGLAPALAESPANCGPTW